MAKDTLYGSELGPFWHRVGEYRVSSICLLIGLLLIPHPSSARLSSLGLPCGQKIQWEKVQNMTIICECIYANTFNLIAKPATRPFLPPPPSLCPQPSRSRSSSPGKGIIRYDNERVASRRGQPKETLNFIIPFVRPSVAIVSSP